MKRITIMGASGFTGKLICDQLEEKQINFQIAVRDPKKLARFDFCQKIFMMNADNNDEIKVVLENTDILINCIGPFSLLSQTIISEVVKYPIYYLDITGEQSFVKQSYDFKNNQACIIHSCSFESALVDLMSYQLLDKNKEYKSIQSFYAFESGGPSPGTRFTMKVHSFFDQYVVQSGTLVKSEKVFGLSNLNIPGTEKLNAAYFTPYPEVIYFSKHFKVKEAASFSLMEQSMLDFSLNNQLTAGKSLEQVLEKRARLSFKGPTEEERQNQKAQIILHAVDVQNHHETLILSGKDMYGITADLIVEATKILLKKQLPIGIVMSPAEAFYEHQLLKGIVDKSEITLESRNAK